MGLGGAALTRFPRPRLAGSFAAASGLLESVAAASAAVRFLPLGRAVAPGF